MKTAIELFDEDYKDELSDLATRVITGTDIRTLESFGKFEDVATFNDFCLEYFQDNEKNE